MQFEPIPCHESLRPFIRNYWLLTAQCTAPGMQRIYSNGAASLHFYLTQNVRLDNSSKRFRTALNRHDLGYMVLHTEEGIFNILGVEFVPFCARLFFPNLTTDMAHLSPYTLADQSFIDLSTKIHASQDTQEQVALLDDFFCQRLCDIPIDERNIERLSSVFNEIVPTEGDPVAIKDFESLSPADLASTACLGQKQFTRVFNKYVGMNPKAYLRLLRFHKALQKLRAVQSTPAEKAGGPKAISLRDIAAECGYYDLPHMTADFRDICGYSPSELISSGAELTEAFGQQFSGLMKKKIKIENLI